MTLLFQSIPWIKWTRTCRRKNSYSILEYLTCKVKKPPRINMRNLQNFSSTKEQNLQNKFTLSHFRNWNNVYTDAFHNSQMGWLANCLAGSLQPQSYSICGSQVHIFQSLPYMELSLCFSEDFRNFYFFSKF